MYCYSKSNIGYSHIKSGTPCQDFSLHVLEKDGRIIIAACDGHGGKQYIRSDMGSLFASIAVRKVFEKVSYDMLKEGSEAFLKKVRLSLLCEWNDQVDRHLKDNPFKEDELKPLDDKQRKVLAEYPEKAYGTTLNGAMLLKDKLLLAKIGDGESLRVVRKELVSNFNEEDEPVANFTYSMCQDDTFDHLHCKVLDANGIDGIFLCTDGVINPYQNISSFNNNLILPLMKELLTSKSTDFIDNYIEDLGMNKGIGDDVSLAFIIPDEIDGSIYLKKDDSKNSD